MINRFKNLSYFLSLFFFIFIINAQSQSVNTDLLTAKKLYSEKEYEKAIILFEKIYKKNKSSKIYGQYLDCLIKLSKLETAIKLVKNYYKKQSKNPSILIDLGELYTINGDEELAEKEFKNVINEIEKNPNFIASVASNFYKKKTI